jgi:exonuclease III
MCDRLTVLSWNLNGETSVSDSQVRAQLRFLDEHCSDVDVFLLQAVRNLDTTADNWDVHLDAVQSSPRSESTTRPTLVIGPTNCRPRTCSRTRISPARTTAVM